MLLKDAPGGEEAQRHHAQADDHGPAYVGGSAQGQPAGTVNERPRQVALEPRYSAQERRA